MSNMKETYGPVAKSALWVEDTHRASGRGSLFSVQGLKEAAQRIADVRRGAGFHTRDLVGLLICHAARNKRMSLPRAAMRMTLPVKFNHVAMRLTIEN
ncbi:hypothetical protein P041_00783 [Brucella sp. 04-5288]|uniref:hypothetical protein n=1 Tax=Brucella sp. 04-5288 TaxID=1341688 RepID=UPI0003B98FE8|nr:hypothetical protein [Brucella sp. 04-5288]ERT99714.1 hypothetical protein P041_00783 [Brucella sp. 04-5288]